MLNDGHWSHRVMLEMICQGSISLPLQRTVNSKCSAAFNIRLPAPRDAAAPLINVKPYIQLIYTTGDVHLDVA